MSRDFGFDEEDSSEQLASTNTVLSQLKAELSKPLSVAKEVVFKVPARDGISVRYSTDISMEQLERWRFRARKNPKREEIDIMQFNFVVLTALCKGIVFGDEDAVDEEGNKLNFRNQQFIDLVGALEPAGAIKALYDRDADIIRVGSELLEAAGYGDDEEDPLG